MKLLQPGLTLAIGVRQRSARSGDLLLLAFLLAAICPQIARSAFVYESENEFLTAGDFNGDGIVDALVLDKLTGNARVGYQNPAGTLVWSASLPTGPDNVTGCAVG